MTGTAGSPGPPLSRRGLLSAGIGLAAGSLLAAGCAAAPTAPAPGSYRTPAPRRDPGADYRAVDGFLYAPDGTLFTPVGANVGTTSSFDWKGDARGHADAALAWGWNTIRLNLMVTAGHTWSYVAQRSQQELLELVRRIVDEYTAAGIVVVLSAHDDPRADGLDRTSVETELAQWWRLAGTAFAGNPRVWHGLINEPDYLNEEWLEVMDALAGAVRGTGNRAPILLGAPGWGQDLGYTGPYFTEARFAYEPSMAPELAKRHGNVLLEQHNYGAFGLYSTAGKFGEYIETVRASGLTPLIGEFGYTASKEKSPDIYAANYDAAAAVLEIAAEREVGALWWHATHGDNYSLTADGAAFWTRLGGTGLSDGGSRLWQFGHRQR